MTVRDLAPHSRSVVAPGAAGVAKLYGISIEKNAIHGSDSPENAALELAFFFSRAEFLAAR